MTPAVPSVLIELAGLMARNAEPGVPDGERANALRLSAGLLGMAAERWDSAADNLVRENRALAALLDDAAAEDDLRVSALGVENARLRGRLIEAHIAAEQLGDAARLDAIWAELVASTERRKISTAPV
jgi:hypothetical protein